MLVIGLVFGLVQGFLVGYLEIQPFIITMAGMFFARGMTAVICTDQVSITEADSPMFYSCLLYTSQRGEDRRGLHIMDMEVRPS